MAFYKSGRAAAGFEGGVRDALSAILASPHFLYRAESGDAAGGTRTLSDLELASRLSFFLWSSLPDEELLKLATESRLSNPDVLAAQVSRMLADPRAKSLSDDFAFQWLHRRQAGRDHPGPRPVSARERPAGSARAVQGRTAAVHRQRAAQRSQRDRAADRGLHVPQRAPGDALRHRDGQGQPLPPRDARRQGAPRPAGQGRDPDVDRVSQSHVARAAWRLDPGSPARHAAVRSAAQRSDAAGEQTRSAGENAAGTARAAPRERRRASRVTA